MEHQNMAMRECLTPCILLSEMFFHRRRAPGVIADALARAADDGFYGGAEIPEIAGAEDKRRIAETVRSAGFTLMQWLSLVIYEEQLNLSAVDEGLRARSVARVVELIDPALECGADTVGVLSGPDPGPEWRERATGQLRASLTEILDAIRARAPLRLVLEPLDREAHKRFLIGPTGEAIALARSLRPAYPEFSLSWDAGHVALNGEDALASLSLSRDCVSRLHISNAILDRDQPGFGDYHMPVGPPGFMTVDLLAALLSHGMEWGILGERRPCLAVEVRTPEDGDPWETDRQNRQALSQAWELVASGRAP